MTIGEAARQILGGVTFDAALPQTWVDDVCRHTGCLYIDALANFVWVYDEAAGISGRPCALTEAGNEILHRYNQAVEADYPLTPNPVSIGDE